MSNQEFLKCPSCKGHKTILGQGMITRKDCQECNAVGWIKNSDYVEKSEESETIQNKITLSSECVPDDYLESLNDKFPKKQRGRPKKNG